jgi:hypothetical protein
LIALALIIQECEGARIQADLLYRKFDFGSCNSLFFEINSLIRPEKFPVPFLQGIWL